jgi:ABC-type phosphate transport system substrate-binding protein
VRILRTMVAVAAVAATATALAVAPAMADPVNGHGKAVTPKVFDIVGVGSNTTEYLIDQLSVDYNAAHSKKHNATHPWIYSWDAVPPGNPTDQTSTIRTKAGCPKIARPLGSGAGVTTLFDNTKTGGHFCVDFARSSSYRSSGQPTFGPGGSAFVVLAKDAVTWATNSSTNAPANLTTADLKGIYGTCTITNWKQVGGKNSKIDPILPQTTSGTRKFFLTQIGGGTAITPGPCVNTKLPEENEGTDPVFKNNKNIIVPFSVGSYISQVFHSAACKKKPKSGQNEFGCDAVGHLVLRDLNGKAPTSGKGTRTTINSHFTSVFVRTLYDVVRYDAATSDHVPPLLDAIFGRHGYFCSATGKKVIAAYGFKTTPLCGIAS